MVLENLFTHLLERKATNEGLNRAHAQFLEKLTIERRTLLEMQSGSPTENQEVFATQEKKRLGQIEGIAKKLIKDKKYARSFILTAQKFSTTLSSEIAAGLVQIADGSSTDVASSQVIFESLIENVWLLTELSPQGMSRREFMGMVLTGAFVGTAAYIEGKTLQHPALLEEVVAVMQRPKRNTEDDDEGLPEFNMEAATEYLFKTLLEQGVSFKSEILYGIAYYIVNLCRLYRDDPSLSDKNGLESFKFFVESVIQKAHEVEVPLRTFLIFIYVGANNYFSIGKFENRIQEAVNEDIDIYRLQLGVRIATQILGIPQEVILYQMSIHNGMRYQAMKRIADLVNQVESTELFGNRLDLSELRKKLSKLQHTDAMSGAFHPLFSGRLVATTTQTFFDMESECIAEGKAHFPHEPKENFSTTYPEYSEFCEVLLEKRNALEQTRGELKNACQKFITRNPWLLDLFMLESKEQPIPDHMYAAYAAIGLGSTEEAIDTWQKAEPTTTMLLRSLADNKSKKDLLDDPLEYYIYPSKYFSNRDADTTTQRLLTFFAEQIRNPKFRSYISAKIQEHPESKADWELVENIYAAYEQACKAQQKAETILAGATGAQEYNFSFQIDAAAAMTKCMVERVKALWSPFDQSLLQDDEFMAFLALSIREVSSDWMLLYDKSFGFNFTVDLPYAAESQSKFMQYFITKFHELRGEEIITNKTQYAKEYMEFWRFLEKLSSTFHGGMNSIPVPFEEKNIASMLVSHSLFRGRREEATQLKIAQEMVPEIWKFVGAVNNSGLAFASTYITN